MVSRAVERVFNELYAGNFSTANNLVDASLLPKETCELISALSHIFGNNGLITGDMGVIIKHALSNINVFDDHTTPTLTIVKVNK